MDNIKVCVNFDGMTFDVPINVFKFPGGEVHVRLDCANYNEEVTHIKIRADIKSSDDVMSLLLVTDALKRKFIGVPINLVMPYFPYARQDRVAVKGEPLSAAVFANIINSQGYASVYVWDAHSDVTEALVNNVRSVKQWDIVSSKIRLQDYVLVCPDAGARKKINKLAEVWGIDKIIYAEKIRNPITGAITGTKIVDMSSSEELWGINGSDLLIVDDICDGGGTFVALATELKEYKPNSISLYVTHGIFSKGLTVFDGLIDTIYVANLFDKNLMGSSCKVNLEIV